MQSFTNKCKLSIIRESSQGNVVITQAELNSMSSWAAEALLQDSQISVADGKSSPSVKRSQPKLTQEMITTMSPQAVEAMFKNPYVELDTMGLQNLWKY